MGYEGRELMYLQYHHGGDAWGMAVCISVDNQKGVCFVWSAGGVEV